MKNYYFTFGQAHWNREGYPMKNSWVRVVAESYNMARSIFINEFAINWMEKADKWSFQYEEDKFEQKHFPNGEFMALYQKPKPHLKTPDFVEVLGMQTDDDRFDNDREDQRREQDEGDRESESGKYDAHYGME